MGTLAVLAIIMIVNVFSENPVFPSRAGKGVSLPPAILFLTLFYWNCVPERTGVLLSATFMRFFKLIPRALMKRDGWTGWRDQAEDPEDS